MDPGVAALAQVTQPTEYPWNRCWHTKVHYLTYALCENRLRRAHRLRRLQRWVLTPRYHERRANLTFDLGSLMGFIRQSL